jgi:hypothetical protein
MDNSIYDKLRDINNSLKELEREAYETTDGVGGRPNDRDKETIAAVHSSLDAIILELEN